MKKIFLFTFLFVAGFYSEAQKNDIRTKFINCGAVKMQNSDLGIVQEINDKGKITFTKEYTKFAEPVIIKKYLYLKVWKKLWFGIGVSDYLEKDDINFSLLSYRKELYDTLNYIPKEKNFMITFSSKISFQEYSYKVEITDIILAKVKKKNGKIKTGKKQTIESVFQKRQPNCEIINYLDEKIVFLFYNHLITGQKAH